MFIDFTKYLNQKYLLVAELLIFGRRAACGPDGKRRANVDLWFYALRVFELCAPTAVNRLISSGRRAPPRHPIFMISSLSITTVLSTLHIGRIDATAEYDRCVFDA